MIFIKRKSTLYGCFLQYYSAFYILFDLFCFRHKKSTRHGCFSLPDPAAIFYGLSGFFCRVIYSAFNRNASLKKIFQYASCCFRHVISTPICHISIQIWQNGRSKITHMRVFVFLISGLSFFLRFVKFIRIHLQGTA